MLARAAKAETILSAGRAAAAALQQLQPAAANAASARGYAESAASSREDPRARLMKCEESLPGGGTISGFNDVRPKLGTWPTVEPGVPKPDTPELPQVPISLAETKQAIIGGVSDMDLIAEYDRIRGTSDLNDNANVTGSI